jgi:hypothetical protein
LTCSPSVGLTVILTAIWWLWTVNRQH